MVKLLQLKVKYDKKSPQNHIFNRQKPLIFSFLVTSSLLRSSTDFDLNVNILQLLQERCEVYYKCRGVKQAALQSVFRLTFNLQ